MLHFFFDILGLNTTIGAKSRGIPASAEILHTCYVRFAEKHGLHSLPRSCSLSEFARGKELVSLL